MAVGKNGSMPHSKDVLTPNAAMQWRRKSLLAEQLPRKTQIAPVSPPLGKGVKANGIAGGSRPDHACLSGVPHKNNILCQIFSSFLDETCANTLSAPPV